MNADRYGNPAEQRRAAARWIAASLRQSAPDYLPERRCRNCRHVTRIVGYRCQKNGYTTQSNAVCADYHKGLDS